VVNRRAWRRCLFAGGGAGNQLAVTVSSEVPGRRCSREWRGPNHAATKSVSLIYEKIIHVGHLQKTLEFRGSRISAIFLMCFYFSKEKCGSNGVFLNTPLYVQTLSCDNRRRAHTRTASICGIATSVTSSNYSRIRAADCWVRGCRAMRAQNNSTDQIGNLFFAIIQ
jgi:hypothetical protein